LYLVITVVRNIVEPKLVGHQIGLSPIVTLPCMLVGLKLFGIAGLIAAPLIAAFLKNLKVQGMI
jgi:predicted PurR-regulated permease PerM